MQVGYDEEGEMEHNLHLTANAHAHYEHPGSGGPAYSPFRHPGGGAVPAIDPGLDQSTAANRNVHTPTSAVPHQAPPNHLLQPDNAGHLTHSFYGDMRSSQTPPASANASPRFSAISPTSQPRQVTAHYVPEDRNPPPHDVSDETIDDAYAAFILYCNPHFPTSIDTTELVKLFRTPPKSDGNAFSTWALFELIRKFDAKEIKTWTQLALDLGVKPPNTDEGQSTQKVQQYSVRLKVRLSTSFMFHISSICWVTFLPNTLVLQIFLIPTMCSCMSSGSCGAVARGSTEPSDWVKAQYANRATQDMGFDKCGPLRPGLRLLQVSEGPTRRFICRGSSALQDATPDIPLLISIRC
jgi:hypothetical protein